MLPAADIADVSAIIVWRGPSNRQSRTADHSQLAITDGHPMESHNSASQSVFIFAIAGQLFGLL